MTAKFELKDEELEKVNGGSNVTYPDCVDFSLNPSRDKSTEIEKYKMDWTYNCHDCINWKGPEGPCKLGH